MAVGEVRPGTRECNLCGCPVAMCASPLTVHSADKHTYAHGRAHMSVNWRMSLYMCYVVDE